MKKLNRKGFTLIELLAVIVVLAIVLVVTIPSVISSMDTAREKNFANVISTIEDYMTKQYELCNIGSDFVKDDEYNGKVFNTGTCVPVTTADIIIKAAGYNVTDDVTTITGCITTSGRYEISAATGGTTFNSKTYSATVSCKTTS